MPIKPHDVHDMAKRYAEAWSSHSPDAVTSFYEPEGRIAINDGDGLSGRAAIAEMAQGFFDAFPNLVVHLDEIRVAGHNAVFLWTLEGTHFETKNFVKVSGWEEWRLSDSLLVAESLGRFDAVEYDRQIAEGL